MQKGEIHFISFNDLDSIDLSIYDLKIHPTLYINKGIKTGFEHIPALAPSRKLFEAAMYKWKKVKFSKEEWDIIKNGPTKTWFDLYKPQFLKDSNNKHFLREYNKLCKALQNEKKIIVTCYCENKKYCHLTILEELLKNDGYKTKFL